MPQDQKRRKHSPWFKRNVIETRLPVGVESKPRLKPTAARFPQGNADTRIFVDAGKFRHLSLHKLTVPFKLPPAAADAFGHKSGGSVAKTLRHTAASNAVPASHKVVLKSVCSGGLRMHERRVSVTRLWSSSNGPKFLLTETAPK